MKKLFALLLSAVMTVSLFSACGEETQSPPSDNLTSDEAVMAVPESQPETEISDITPAEGKISVVVLGDSIAQGYGLKNLNEERFSAVLGNLLSKDYAEVGMANYGVNRMNGAELVEFLQKEPPAELATADYVLLSIGANNILQPLLNLLLTQEFYSNIDPQIFTDYLKYIFSGESTQAADYALKTLDSVMQALNSVLTGEGFQKLLEDAVNNLKSEIPAIISRIKQSNPEARIIFQTVYNPYKGVVISLSGVEHFIDMSSIGNDVVERINAVITSLSAEYGYEIAQVKAQFDLSPLSLTNAGFALLKPGLGLDPHPNAEGHELIGEIYYEMLKN